MPEEAENIDDAVPKSVFDVTHMPIKQAIAAWHEAVGTVNNARFHSPPEQRLPARIELWHLGEVLVGMMDTVSQELKRSRTHIGIGGGDCYSVSFIEDGTVYFPQQDIIAYPGDMLVQDKGEPLTLHLNTLMPGATNRTLALFIPQRLLDPLLAIQEKKSAMVFDGRLPLVALLRQHLYALQGQLPDMRLAQAQTIIQPTVELLSAAMNGSIAKETNAYAVENAVLKQIERHIGVHIENPALSAATIAAAFGMSVRKLYQLFEPFGGVVAYIQKKRLGLVHAALVNPAQQHKNIQDIAESFGFLHRKNFNAAFRRLYGITPRQARVYAAGGDSRNLREIYAKLGMWDWMLELR